MEAGFLGKIDKGKTKKLLARRSPGYTFPLARLRIVFL